MRILFFIFCILFSFNTFGQKIGLKKLPSLEFSQMNGKRIAIDQLVREQQLTIISFWATWCKPCLQEMEAISELYEDWQETYDLRYVAVSTDNSRQSNKVKSLSLAKGWDFEVLLDSEQKAKQLLNFANIPYLLIVNQSGDVLYSHSGYLPGFEEDLEDVLTSLRQ